MPNFSISDMAPITLPLDPATTFFETQTEEGGLQVSRKVAASDLGVGGSVISVVGGININVDATDPLNPIVNLDAAIVGGVSVNAVTLFAGGVATNFLNETGAYSVPPGAGQVDSVVGGINITVNAADPLNPIVDLDAAITGVSVNAVTLSAAGAATSYLDETGAYSVPPGGGGQVDSVVGGTNISVNAGDPVNPIVNLDAAITGVSVDGVTLNAAGVATNYLDETGSYSVPPSGGGSLGALSDVNLTGQAQYDLLFNVDGTNWEDSAGNLILDIAALALQFADGYSINMGAAPLRVLEVASTGTPSVTIEHTTVEVIAEVSTVSNVEVPLTGGTLPLLTEGDEYLLMAVAQHHQGNTGGENVHGADIAVAQASGVPFSNMRDDIEPPACAVASDQGQWFTGLNQIQYSVATHGQITLEHSAGAGQTHYVNNAILMAFNLTDFGTENVDWFASVTAPFVTVTDAGWSNLTPSITVGDGVSDWLIFGSFQSDQPQAGGQIQYGLFDGSVNSDFAMHQFADVADIKSIFFSAVFTGIASTTFQTAARAVAASGNTARIFTSGIYALRLNRFAQYSIQSASGPTSPPSAAEFSLLTDSVVASSNSDWGILAFVRNQWVANTLSGTTYGRANINAGGFTTIAGFDTPPISVVENATVELTPKQMVPRIAELTGVVATDTVGAELRWIPPTNFGPTRAAVYNMVMFTWDTLDTSVNATTLGDPTIGTQIDGLTLNIAGNYTLPVADGGAGEVLTTDGAGAVTFTPAGVPDPLILSSINLTSALGPTIGTPYVNLPINVGANLIGTMGMTTISRQRIQTMGSAFSFNAQLFINIEGTGTNGGDVFIGGLNSASIEVEYGVAVRFQHGLVAAVVAETTSAAAGGFLANNLATGAGLERVLTTADLGGGGIAATPTPAIGELAVWDSTGATLAGEPELFYTGTTLRINNGLGGACLDLRDGNTTGPTANVSIDFTDQVGTSLGAVGYTIAGTLIQCVANQVAIIAGTGGTSKVVIDALSIQLEEKAAPGTNNAGYGQYWVRNAVPCRPEFRDDTDVNQLLDPSISEINTQNNNYTLLLTDKGKTVHRNTNGVAETWTIPAQASVNYPIGTWIAFYNDGGNTTSIAITTDLMRGTDGFTGTRVLGDNQRALIQKVASALWVYQATDL